MTAHIVFDLWSHIWALSKAVRLFIASLHNQSMYPKMCSIDIFDDLKLVGWNLKGGHFYPRFRGIGGRTGSGIGPFDNPLMGSYYLPIDIYGLSLTVFQLFSLLQKHFRPSVRPGYDDN